MKNSIKDKLFNYMFNTLCKERHSDLIRAVSAMQSGEKRGSKSAVLRKWFRETTGETPELSSEQLKMHGRIFGARVSLIRFGFRFTAVKPAYTALST